MESQYTLDSSMWLMSDIVDGVRNTSKHTIFHLLPAEDSPNTFRVASLLVKRVLATHQRTKLIKLAMVSSLDYHGAN
jgi:hypothetical protein